MDVLVLIDKLDDLIHNARSVPLTDSVMIDREEIYDLLDQMRSTIPEEVKQARWIVKERQEMLAEAKQEADRIIAEATDRVIRNRLTRSADYYEIGAEGFRNCPPPMDVVRDLLALPPLEWGFPALQGIIEAPALREDGTIITEPGYDEQSHLFYAPDDGLHVPEIPEHPTADVQFWEEDLAGSNAGRFLMAAGNTLRWVKHPELRQRLDAVVAGIAECRQANGYVMAYPENTIFYSERGAYTRAWLTHGLIEAA